MECLIGIRFNNFILLSADSNAGRSVITMKTNADKIYKLSDKLALAICGDSGSAVRFAECILQNVQLSKLSNGYEMCPTSVANFCRWQLADNLRTNNAFNVNVLIAGVHKSEDPKLFFLDYFGALVEVPFAIHGYGSYVGLSVLDSKYKPDMSREEAVNLLKECILEIQQRLVYNIRSFKVKIIDAEGITNLPDMKIGN